MIKNEKSLKKDGRKKFFHFLIIFFQEFNPLLDHYWPLIHSMQKDNLLHLNNLQVN